MCIQSVLNKGMFNTGRKSFRYPAMNDSMDEESTFNMTEIGISSHFKEP